MSLALLTHAGMARMGCAHVGATHARTTPARARMSTTAVGSGTAAVSRPAVARPHSRLASAPTSATTAVAHRTHTKSRRSMWSEAALAAAAVSGAVAVCTSAFLVHRYEVARSNEYLAYTGLGIKDILISKRKLRWPFQRSCIIDMTPRNLEFDTLTMSKEMIEFVCPGVMTVGPADDDTSLINFARFMQGSGDNADHIILGMVEGEVRTLTSSMTIEDIFNNRELFRQHVVTKVEADLIKIGLKVHNLNMREIHDTPNNNYFETMRQQKMSRARNESEVVVAEANKTGDVGKKEREAETRQRVALFEAETIKQENARRQEMESSKAQLEVLQAQLAQQTNIAKIESDNAAKLREAELQRSVEQERLKTETERLRAQDLSQAQVRAETTIKEAEAEAAAVRLRAEAQLYSQQKMAEGVQAVYTAQAEGLKNLTTAVGGDSDTLVRYLMLEKGVYEKMAEMSAHAVRDMKPNISVWHTTGSGGSADGTNYAQPVADILKMLPPVLSTIEQQTGMKPPEWLLQTAKKNNTDKNTDKKPVEWMSHMPKKGLDKV